MFRVVILSIFAYIECSPYEYDTNTRYPSSTISTLYNNNPYKSPYGDTSYSDGTRYPGYSPTHGYSTYSTSRYPNYNTNYNNGYSTSGYNSLYGAGSSNVNYNSNSNNYNLQRYGAGYGQGVSSNYNTGYGSVGYGTSGYGSSGYSTSGYGSSGYSTPGYGSTGYSTPGYGSTAYGSPGDGSTGYGYGTSGYGTSGYGSGLGNGLGSGLDSGYGTVRYGSGGYGSGGYNSGQGAGYYGRSGSEYGSSYGTGYTAYEAPFAQEFGSCANRSPQNGVWIDGLMGMWYGVELVTHLGTDRHWGRRETCIVVHIAEPMDRPSTENQLFHVQHINARFRQQYRHLRLLWDEAGETLEYALYFRNDSAGYWQAVDGQNGTLSNRRSYKQFSGTVQVLKAVNDHLLLNFCQPGGYPGKSPQLYSVLLSRVPGALNRWDIEQIHSILQLKKLSVASRRMVCGHNDADRPLSFIVSTMTCLLALVISSA